MDDGAPAVARRLGALPSAAIRRAVLFEVLERLDADRAAALISDLQRRGPSGAPYDVALLALISLLDEGRLGYDRHVELYAAAVRAGDPALQRLLLSAEPPPPGRPQPAAIPDRPELTLGERKALARGRRRELLDRLLRDPDADVLKILLGNPRITEADVVRLAARRPTTAAAQRVIFQSERFIARYAIKRALVFNPYTPSDLAVRLTPLLSRPDLSALAHDPTLPESVRQAALAAQKRHE
jgi:hypothetical protein